MGSISLALGSLSVEVSIQVNESPVISRSNNILTVISVDSIHMVSTGSRWKNTLNPPTKLASVSGPFLIPELSGSTLKLFFRINIIEQKFIGPAIGLDVFPIPRPVHIGDERLVRLKLSMKRVNVSAHFENVNIIVMRSNCQHAFVWGVFHDFNPLF